MAKISQDAYWFAVLYGMCASRGKSTQRLAMLVDNRGWPKGLARGTGRPPNSTRTSVVNVIQHVAQTDGRSLRKAIIYTTERVTEMDLGMARRCGVDAIMSTGSGEMYWHKTKLDSHDGAGTRQTLGGNFANAPWIGGRKSRTAWIDPANFNTYSSDLADYYRADRNDKDVKAMRGLSEKAGGLTPLTFTVPVEGKNLGTSQLGLTDPERHLMFLATAHQLVGQVWGERSDTDQNRKSTHYVGWNIGALLVDASGDNILAWGVNTNKANTTRHGEVNLIQHYEAKLGTLPLPQNATFYTTLEPCQMCAGMLASVGRRNGLKVVWGQDDTAISQSALQRNGLGVGQSGSAKAFGVHAWADIIAERHKEAATRMRDQARKVVRQYKNKGYLPQKQYNALQEAERFLDGLQRFGSVQTTEFLRQAEAHLFFGRARARRQMSGVMRELTDIRNTLEGLGGTFKPSTVRGVQDVDDIIGDLLVDQAPLLDTHRKLDSFVRRVGSSMSRT